MVSGGSGIDRDADGDVHELNPYLDLLRRDGTMTLVGAPDAPTRSRKTGGYGLGLSICKRIVEAHGGEIRAVNNPGRGASFILRFPVPPA